VAFVLYRNHVSINDIKLPNSSGIYNQDRISFIQYGPHKFCIFFRRGVHVLKVYDLPKQSGISASFEIEALGQN